MLATPGMLSTQDVLADGDAAEEQILDYDDPVAILIREHKAEKQKQDEQAIVIERHQQQWQASEQEKQDDEDRRLREWFASPEYRRAINALATDVDDAKKATALARDSAAIEQQQAREALEKARRDALVVEDGRRVYFTRDGSRLYGEDDQEITNAGTIAEAQRQQRDKPDATTYEDYTARKKASQAAADKTEQLSETARKLDELEKRIKKGNLNPEELAQARRDEQEIVDAMPAAARAEYTRLQAARKDGQALTYRAADPAFTSAPDLKNDFRQATAAANTEPQTGQGSQPPQERRPPAYKAAPDY